MLIIDNEKKKKKEHNNLMVDDEFEDDEVDDIEDDQAPERMKMNFDDNESVIVGPTFLEPSDVPPSPPYDAYTGSNHSVADTVNSYGLRGNRVESSGYTVGQNKQHDVVPRWDAKGRRYTSRERMVVSSVLEKSLVNLGVVAEIKVGDKISRTADGNFVIQKPSWVTTMYRLFRGVDRWQMLTHLSNLVKDTENGIHGDYNDPRIERALVHAVHGFRNLQKTYNSDELFRSTIEVLLGRIIIRYGLTESQML